MKNKMKRVLAFLLASIMVMASCMTVLAVDGEAPKTPADTDTAKITVTNVDSNATVKAYKIVEAIYSGDTVSYQTVSAVTAAGLSITNPINPTAAEINAIADKINAGELTLSDTTMDRDVTTNTTFSQTVKAGEYVVIAKVTTEPTVTYNPIHLSAHYDAANTLQGTSAKAKVSATPNEEDKETITVTDVKTEATVNAYRIVEPIYDANGFVGYKLADAVANAKDGDGNSLSLSIADFESPTSNEIYAIANAIANGYVELEAIEMDKTGEGSTTFTKEVGAGEYIVIASGANDVIYNPMLLSVYYSVSGSDNIMTTDPVSANDNWELNGDNAKAKSSEPEITKKITSPADGANTDGHGSDAAVGDTIGYQIDATIPSYSAEYKEVEYIITDTLSETLEAPVASGITVKVGEDTVWSDTVTSNSAIKEVSVTGQVIKIEFTSDYILVNGGKTVSVTYSAKLKENASVNMDANTNGAKVEYSNDPSDKSKHAEKDDKTYVYTFELDGKITGKEVMGNIITHELIKVDENGNEQDQGFITDELVKTEVTNALAGATFTLTKLKEDGVTPTDVVYTANTDANGYFNGFTGLDAGKYVLKETAAPDGYTIDDKSHSVVISAEYNPNGTLKSYTILIDGTATSTYTAEYEGDTLTKITPGEPQTTYIQNTKLQNLPSTGGIGTYIFTVLGVALMVIAAVLYMRKRRQAQ